MDAAQKTIGVLDALGEAAGPSRLGDLAARTGLSKPTVHRILQRLVETGYARREEGGVYVPGPRILTLAGHMLHGLDPANRFAPALRRLQDDLGFTVHCAALTGDEAVYVEKLADPRGAYQTASRVGMRLPLHCTAIGKAVLAVLPREDVRGIVARTGLEARTTNTRTTIGALERDLEAVRARGFALDDEENERNIRCVGAVVLDHRGRPFGAVSVSALVFELDHEQAIALGPRVRAAADELSTALGAPAGTRAAPAA